MNLKPRFRRYNPQRGNPNSKPLEYGAQHHPGV